MCGRYVLYMAPHRLKDLFGTDNLPNFPPRYNAAPMQEMPVVIRHRMGMARWGFLPLWTDSDNPVMAAKMINARSETITEKPAFRNSWAKGHRCLIPANGFYEWKKDPDTGVNQPYYITDPERDCIAFAGLWSKAGGVVTYTILTKEADGDIAELHHRSPAIIDLRQADEWFGASHNRAMELIKNSSARRMVFYPVDTRVGKVANDSEDLIKVVKTRRQEALAL